MAHLPVRNALISVSDKRGLEDLARGLAEAGATIYSTGGTRGAIQAAGVEVRDVAEYTGFPEMMDGRVKTLHPKVFAGVLCRRDRDDDMAALEKHGIVPFDLVVVNLYPFRETVARQDVSLADAVEQIDIGGPSLLRAAAKNHAFVAVATSPDQYEELLQRLRNDGNDMQFRRRLAGAAFDHTAAYDAAISAWFAGKFREEEYPPVLNLSLDRRAPLRYGENPHQSAALYAQSGAEGANLLSARQLNGKELSYNNLLDLDSALAMVRLVATPAVAVIKHNNPCGAATHETLSAATRSALDGDPLSAFGSVLGFNRAVDAASAEVLAEPERFIEAIVAPEFEPEALEILTTKPKWKANVRLLATGEPGPPASGHVFRPIDGGFLVQQPDTAPDDEQDWRVVTKSAPGERQMADLEFGWSMVRHVKSNAIALCRERSLVGVGAGQMSRVDSVNIAIEKAGDRSRGSVLASDAFFPFPDSIESAAAAGVSAIIQPGGSRGDERVIAACDTHGLAMLFTGRRHFRH